MTTPRPEKPPHGSPCNGCGQCCEEVLCPLGEGIFQQSEGPCPALGIDPAGKSACGLVVDPAAFAPVRAFLIGAERLALDAAILTGAGIGCDALLEGEDDSDPESIKLYLKIMLFREKRERAIARAFKHWGVARRAPPRAKSPAPSGVL